MGVAQTRLDSIADLEIIFDRTGSTGSQSGAWVVDSGGSTPTGNTGPGTNSGGPYVHTECSGGATFQQIRENSVLEVKSAVMNDWVGDRRLLRFRAAVMSQSGRWSVGEGLQIQGRVLNTDDWSDIHLVHGWTYSNSHDAGDQVIDVNSERQDIAQDGGWVDFEVAIPNDHTQVRIYDRAESGGSTYSYDIALWHIELVDGTTTPTNQSPTIDFTTSAAIVDGLSVTTIQGTVDDAEDDNNDLMVELTTTLGTLSAVTHSRNDWEATLTAPAVTTAQQPMEVTATVTDSEGATGTATRTWTVRANQDPTLVLDEGDQNIDPGDTLDITAMAAAPESGQTVAVTWEALDGGTLSSTTGDTTTFTAPAGQATDQTYRVRATATDNLGGVTTVTIMLTVPAVQAPNRPDAPTVTATGTDSLSAEWTAPTGGDPADSFDLRFRTGANAWTERIGVNSPYSITGLTPSTDYEVQVRGVNVGGNGNWSLSGSATTNTPVPRPPDYGIEVDWSGDTLYAHAESDVSGDVLRAPIRTLRGRNYASVIYGRSIAGRMTWTLRNSDRKYDRDNTTSPLFGLNVPQRLVRLNMDTPNLGNNIIWQGFLDKPKERNVRSGRDTMEMYALDAISRLVAEERLSIPMHQTITCASAMQEIIDQIDLPSVLRGTLSGSTVMERWWVNSQNGHLAAQAVEETEGGFLHIDRQGRLTLDNRHRRLTGTSATSQVTLTDDRMWVRASEVPVRMANPEDPTQDIANRVDVPVRSYRVGTEETLWSSTIVPVVPANSQIVIHVNYPYEGVARSHVAVETWIDPVAGTDYQGASTPTGADNRNGDLTVTQTYTANRATLTVANGSSSAVYLTLLQLRGQPLIEEQILSVPREDATSIGLYGPRDYPVPQQFISDTNEALGYADNILHLLANPAKKAKVSYQVHGNLTADLAISLDLSERVTLRTREITQDMFVESIGHTIYPGRRHTVHMTLSPAMFFDDVIILDTGPGLGTGILGR